MTRVLAIGLFLVAISVSCELRPTPAAHVAEARAFTQRYSRSALAKWNVQATAAGDDCAVLFVETQIILEDSMVEAIHYGAGSYDVYDGGVAFFTSERGFRGVAYKDPSGRIWTYGGIDVTGARSLKRCQ